MSSNANTNLVLRTDCTNCNKGIELVVLLVPVRDNRLQVIGTDEMLVWRHVESGLYCCYRPGMHWAQDGNMAAPDWTVPNEQDPIRSWLNLDYSKTTDCAGGCCYNAFKDECVAPDCQCHNS